MKEGPLKSALEQEDDDIVKRVLITYRLRDGVLTKEVVDRKYYGNNYIDSTSSEPLLNLAEKKIE